jgi:hypothetical protein
VVAGAPGDATASVPGPDQGGRRRDDAGQGEGEGPSDELSGLVVVRGGEGVADGPEAPVEVFVPGAERLAELVAGGELVPRDRRHDLEQIGVELDAETMGEATRDVGAGAGLGDHRGLRFVRTGGGAATPGSRGPATVAPRCDSPDLDAVRRCGAAG